MPFWRVFPWDPHAPDGAPFSVRYLPPAGAQTGGRFDLGDPPVLYLAQDPAVLVELDIRPDQLASHDRTVTQAISRRVHAAKAGYPGFRWWSALTGEWHVSVLFMDRVDPREIEYTSPEPLEIGHPAVQAAARFLRMPIPGSA